MCFLMFIDPLHIFSLTKKLLNLQMMVNKRLGKCSWEQMLLVMNKLCLSSNNIHRKLFSLLTLPINL